MKEYGSYITRYKKNYEHTYRMFTVSNYAVLISKILVTTSEFGVPQIIGQIRYAISQGVIECEKVKSQVGDTHRYLVLDSPDNANAMSLNMTAEPMDRLRLNINRRCQPFYDEAEKIIKKRYKDWHALESDIDWKRGRYNIRLVFPIGKWIDEGVFRNGKMTSLNYAYVKYVVRRIAQMITDELGRLPNKGYFTNNRGKEEKVKCWHHIAS